MSGHCGPVDVSIKHPATGFLWTGCPDLPFPGFQKTIAGWPRLRKAMRCLEHAMRIMRVSVAESECSPRNFPVLEKQLAVRISEMGSSRNSL